MDCLPARIEGDAFLRADHPDRRARDARFRARRVAGRSVRDGLPGALRHRQGPDQDELEECGQARRPRGLRIISLQMGGDPHRFQECPQGRRLLPRRAAAHPDRVPGLDAGIARDRRHRPDYHRVDDAGQSWLCGHGGEVPSHVFQHPGDQRPRGCPPLPLRLPGCLVRRRSPGLPEDGPRLEFLAGRWLPGNLGDRLRDRPGERSRNVRQEKRGDGSHSDRPVRGETCLPSRRLPCGDRCVACRESRSDPGSGHRPDPVRDRLRAQFSRALLPRARIHR